MFLTFKKALPLFQKQISWIVYGISEGHDCHKTQAFIEKDKQYFCSINLKTYYRIYFYHYFCVSVKVFLFMSIDVVFMFCSPMGNKGVVILFDNICS